MAIFVLLLPLLFVGVPTALWLRSRDEARRRWLPRQAGTTRVGDDNYRGAEVPRLVASGPPPLVHVTAVMCWILGVAVFPSALFVLLGLLMMGVGVVGIPGLVAAWRLLMLGGPLLRGEPEAADRARQVARYVEVLNVIILSIIAMTALGVGWSAIGSGRVDRSMLSVAVTGALTAIYAAVSLVHVRMLRRSAAAIDADHARRAEQRAPSAGVRVAAPERDEAVGVDVMYIPAAQANSRREGER